MFYSSRHENTSRIQCKSTPRRTNSWDHDQQTPSHGKIIKLLIATWYYNILSLGIILLSNTILLIGGQPMRDLPNYGFLYVTSVTMSIQYKHASGELLLHPKYVRLGKTRLKTRIPLNERESDPAVSRYSST
uniref:Uncharacterized protein n=1 Tax=Opuntia streptacantha TaxID=393608 RepID=A0A7C9CYM5_OPUST